MATNPELITPETLQLAQQFADQRGCSINELILEAFEALEDVERRREELSSELQRRLARAGSGVSQPLDLDAFKAEARRRQRPTDQ